MNDTITKPRPLFELGDVVTTLGATMSTYAEYQADCLMRHVRGDWGCCAEEDKATNAEALEKGGRILSAYPLDPSQPCLGWGKNTLWIITEADRSLTTLLLPEEY